MNERREGGAGWGGGGEEWGGGGGGMGVGGGWEGGGGVIWHSRVAGHQHVQLKKLPVAHQKMFQQP